MHSAGEMASWPEYVDEYLMVELAGGRKLASGAILGLDGGIWASSEAFPELSNEETDVLLQAYDNPDILQSKGLRLNGQKYVAIQGVSGSVVRGRGFEVKTSGFTAKRCEQCIVVGFFGEGVQPGECSKIVEDFADYLIELGY